jgi:hypothetical protein
LFGCDCQVTFVGNALIIIFDTFLKIELPLDLYELLTRFQQKDDQASPLFEAEQIAKSQLFASSVGWLHPRFDMLVASLKPSWWVRLITNWCLANMVFSIAVMVNFLSSDPTLSQWVHCLTYYILSNRAWAKVIIFWSYHRWHLVTFWRPPKEGKPVDLRFLAASFRKFLRMSIWSVVIVLEIIPSAVLVLLCVWPFIWFALPFGIVFLFRERLSEDNRQAFTKYSVLLLGYTLAYAASCGWFLYSGLSYADALGAQWTMRSSIRDFAGSYTSQIVNSFSSL